MPKKNKIYGNICNNINCGINNTSYCVEVNDKKKKNNKCICNLETAHCVLKKHNKDFLKQIDEREKKNIRGYTFSTTKLKQCYIINKHGRKEWYYLKQIKRCFPLPKNTYLKYGILKYDRQLIVYNDNDKYYKLKLENDGLIIKVNRFEVYIPSLKGCNLIPH